jgi:hypothetical protein
LRIGNVVLPLDASLFALREARADACSCGTTREQANAEPFAPAGNGTENAANAGGDGAGSQRVVVRPIDAGLNLLAGIVATSGVVLLEDGKRLRRRRKD